MLSYGMMDMLHNTTNMLCPCNSRPAKKKQIINWQMTLLLYLWIIWLSRVVCALTLCQCKLSIKISLRAFDTFWLIENWFPYAIWAYECARCDRAKNWMFDVSARQNDKVQKEMRNFVVMLSSNRFTCLCCWSQSQNCSHISNKIELLQMESLRKQFNYGIFYSDNALMFSFFLKWK